MEPDNPLDLTKPGPISNEQLNAVVNQLATTVDKLSTNVDRMLEDSALSREVMQQNTAVTQRSKRENTRLRTALITAAAALLIGGVVVWRDHAQSNCVKAWGVATSGRTSKLTKPAADRVTDLYAALGAASGGALKGVTALPPRNEQINYIYKAKQDYPLLVPGTRADIAKQSSAQLSSTYYLIVGLDANNDYVRTAHDNPVPDSPFNCSAF